MLPSPGTLIWRLPGSTTRGRYNSLMNPKSPLLFWSSSALGPIGPIGGNFLRSRLHYGPLFNDRIFLWSWLIWLVSTIVLIGCFWPVRGILLGARMSVALFGCTEHLRCSRCWSRSSAHTLFSDSCRWAPGNLDGATFGLPGSM